jgi:hypothetical protein
MMVMRKKDGKCGWQSFCLAPCAQVSMGPPAGGQDGRACGSAQAASLAHHRPASAPSQQGFSEGAGAFTPMYLHAPEPLAF